MRRGMTADAISNNSSECIVVLMILLNIIPVLCLASIILRKLWLDSWFRGFKIHI